MDETHLPRGSNSQAIVIGKGKSSRIVPSLDSELEALLKAQRSTLSSAFEEKQIIPQVGDVWVSHARWAFGPEDGLDAMLVVLRAFNEVWSSQPLLDVAPVSEDERLASEWSLILGASESGLGLPLVLHIDIQSTTTASMLSRRLGRLEEHARNDLLNMLRAYALSDVSAIELEVGRSGTISIRFHPEWDEFAKQLVALSRAFALTLEGERPREGSTRESSEVEDSSEDRLLAAASGAQRSLSGHCKWEYRAVRPFIHCSGFSVTDIPHRLGEALACYYSTARVKGVQRTASQWLDSETFHRIEPLFDIPLTRFFEHSNVLVAFQNVVDPAMAKALPAGDLKLIVESIRCAKRVSGLTAGTQPMKLAARRLTNE